MGDFEISNFTGQDSKNSNESNSEIELFEADNIENYKSFFYNSPFSIACFNPAGRITDYNSNFANLFELDSISILSFSLFSIQDKKLLSAIKNVLNGSEAHFEGSYKTTSGKVHPVKIVLSPVLKGNKILGGIAYIEDSSFQKQIERFFFHDVLNSCGNIRNLSEILIDSKIDPALKEKILIQINSQSNRLLDDISFYRYLLSAGKSDLKIENTQINSIQLLEQVELRFKTSDILEGQILKIREESTNFVFNCSLLLINKILDILVKFAIFSTKTGDYISLSCSSYDGTCSFLVHNPSVIPQNSKSILFTPEYYKNNGEKGLGTFCMKYLAENYLDGEITFTSTVEGGTEFTFSMPHFK